jgi:ubiquitin-like-conjugating enzyme ATG10
MSPALMQIETADPLETLHGLEYEDEDGLAVVKSEVAPILSCDIVHSASYQVPVLYFQLCNMHWHLPPSLDIIHSILVPDFHKIPVRDVGLLGALSTSDHPVTGLPSFFIHPCQTQTAMASLHIDQFGQPDDYLLAWIGMIGSTVGLSVPLQMASQSVEGTLED